MPPAWPAAAPGHGSDRTECLYRRDGRRPDDAGGQRAVSDVHLARRIPAQPARRQRRSAVDRKRHRLGLRRVSRAQIAFRAHQAALAEAMARARQEGLPAAAMHPASGLRAPSDGRWRSVLDLAGNETVDWPASVRRVSLAGRRCRRASPISCAPMRATPAICIASRAELRLSQREDGVALAGVAFEDDRRSVERNPRSAQPRAAASRWALRRASRA